MRLNGDEGDKSQNSPVRSNIEAVLKSCMSRLDSLRDLLSGAPTDIGRSIAAFLPLQQIARRARAAGQSHGKLQKRALDLKPTNKDQVTQCTDDANGILLCRRELLGNFDAELDVTESVLRPLDRKILELSAGDLAPPDNLFLAVLSQFYEFDDLELQVKRNEIRCLRSFCVSQLKQRFAAPSMLPRFKEFVNEAPDSFSPWKLLNDYLEKLLPSHGEASFGDALTLFSLATCYKMPILVWLPNGKVLQIPPHVPKEAQNRGAIELALLRSVVHDKVEGFVFGVIRSACAPARPRPLPVPIVETPAPQAPTLGNAPTAEARQVQILVPYSAFVRTIGPKKSLSSDRIITRLSFAQAASTIRSSFDSLRTASGSSSGIWKMMRLVWGLAPTGLILLQSVQRSSVFEAAIRRAGESPKFFL